MRKSDSLVRNLTISERLNLEMAGNAGIFLTGDASNTPEIASETVQLTVTSPPFLDVVQYSKDNWLRCWFNSLNVESISRLITMSRSLDDWSDKMATVFKELFRVTRAGGWVAFEVGEVRNGTIKLDEHVVPLGLTAGFSARELLSTFKNLPRRPTSGASRTTPPVRIPTGSCCFARNEYRDCQKLCPVDPQRLCCHTCCIAHPSFPRQREPRKSHGTRDWILPRFSTGQA